MASSKISRHLTDESNQDLISNLPSIAIEKILKRLPIRMAARMSVLSTKWKDIWLSHRHLVFNATFWEDVRGGNIMQSNYGALVAEKVSRIVSNILFHHNGPLHKFYFCIPWYAKGACINLSQWLSFLSRICVKKIVLSHWHDRITIPSYIFVCKELVKLRLGHFVLNPPPRDFKGFANLWSLELVDIQFKYDMFGTLIASCPRLKVLRLEDCTGLDHVIIDVPSLESLIIKGVLCYLSFKNIVRLNNISLCLDNKIENPEGKVVALDSITDLATSCELQYLQFGGRFCEFLAAGGVEKSFPLVFNHLHKLCLTKLNFGHTDVYRFVFGMIQSCPHVKDLEISVESTIDVPKHKIDWNDNYKLSHLTRVKFTGVTGSSAELKFIEYVLAISVELEIFLFRCGHLDATSELKVSRNLLRLRRASTKAQLVCLE
ncbi:hypothetical protein SOVF_007030 [Spinacia oleracea]|uniref:F-box/FBD/LRR-repeat protein At1g13570-like n=1 Tax=Spinacia oleracea TaxID=3562 RepID=A0A9R0HYR1_SPIOL|nr:F-box/FBD/LRR-repeat protein At1g13570-like [Spinacia oleracea]KNA25374.1 hypothetical protein SOVF_007030 [Spinacia oleracea]